MVLRGQEARILVGARTRVVPGKAVLEGAMLEAKAAAAEAKRKYNCIFALVELQKGSSYLNACGGSRGV